MPASVAGARPAALRFAPSLAYGGPYGKIFPTEKKSESQNFSSINKNLEKIFKKLKNREFFFP